MAFSPVPWWRKLLLLSVMESPDFVSVLRRVSRPIFASLGLEGFRFWDFEYCKEMVCLHFYNSTIFCLLYLQEKTTKTRRKNARNLKKIQVRNDDDNFLKNLAKCTKFEVSSLSHKLQVSSLSLGLGVFGEVSVSSRNFNQVLVSVSKVVVSTTSLASMYETSLKYSAVSSMLTSQCSQLCAVYLFKKIPICLLLKNEPSTICFICISFVRACRTKCQIFVHRSSVTHLWSSTNCLCCFSSCRLFPTNRQCLKHSSITTACENGVFRIALIFITNPSDSFYNFQSSSGSMISSGNPPLFA